MSDALKFNQGDRVIVTSGGRFGSPERFRIAQVTKVHKTGNFILNFGDDKWRQNGSKVGKSSVWDRHECVEPYTDARRAELVKADADNLARLRLNKLGDLLSRERDDETGASLWLSLPQALRDMVEAPNRTGPERESDTPIDTPVSPLHPTR